LGFARELALSLEPAISINSGHSMAAGAVGEYVTYFGAAGPAIAVLLVVTHVFAIDRLIPTFDPKGRTFMSSVIGVALSAQLLTLVWGGLQSFWTRGWNLLIGASVVGALIALLVFASTRRLVQAAAIRPDERSSLARGGVAPSPPTVRRANATIDRG
jgi:hypothetical protein